jgi:hypothetical protein
MEEKQLKESIASLLKDSTKREALAALLVEYIAPQHVTTDFVGMLLNSRRLNPGDALVKKIRKGIEVRTLVPGSIHLKSEITVTDRINYVLDGADVGVMWNQWEMESGELGTVESIRAEMLAKLKDYFLAKIFTALTTIWTPVNTPNNYTAVGGPINPVVLKAAIDYINQTVGGVRAVVGVRSALTPITEFGGFWTDPSTGVTGAVDSQLEAVMRDGWLGKYYGAPILALQQQWDNPEDNNALLPTDKVLVIGENVGEFITYGEPKMKMYDDNRPTPPYTFMELWQQFGLMIDKADGIFVLGNIS